jgi:hypothetical protein
MITTAEPKRPSRFAQQRKANRVYWNSARVDTPCKVLWTGPMNAAGVAMIRDGIYRRAAQAACYELAADRLWPGDRVVAVCGDTRCLNGAHLRVIPKRPYRAPRKPRARAVPTASISP